jgi:hypothetical protein
MNIADLVAALQQSDNCELISAEDSRHRAGYFDLRRIVPACRRTLPRRHRLSRAAEKHSSEERYRSGECQKGET